MNNYLQIAKRFLKNVKMGGWGQDTLFGEMQKKFGIEEFELLKPTRVRCYYQASLKGRKIFIKFSRKSRRLFPAPCMAETDFRFSNLLHSVNAKNFPESVFYLNNRTHYCVAFEFLEGKTLSEIISTGTLSPSEKENLLVQLQTISRNLWDAGIVHQDMHAGNFIVGKDGTLKIIDFGTACFYEKQKRFFFLKRHPFLFSLLVRKLPSDRHRDDIFAMRKILELVGFHEHYQDTYRNFESFLNQRLGIRDNGGQYRIKILQDKIDRIVKAVIAKCRRN